MAKILIVDDDLHLRKLVRTYAELEDFTCEEAQNGFEALEKLRGGNFDMIVLDIMMPGLDGFETMGELRKWSQIPVIVLTARDEEYDKLLGFHLGADDYVSKPFSPKELVARIKAVMKRVDKKQDEPIQYGELRVETAARTAFLGEQALSLTPKEFDLLTVLVRNEHLVLSREQLLQQVWGYDYYGDGRAVDTYIKKIRKLIAPLDYIKTIRKSGYIFSKGEH